MWLIGLLLVLLAGVASAAHDVLVNWYDVSIFAKFKNQQFFDPKKSWLNKYKDFTKYGTAPKFPGSTTVLVGFTDAFHLFQLIANFVLIAGTIMIAASGFGQALGTLLCLIGVVALRSLGEGGAYKLKLFIR